MKLSLLALLSVFFAVSSFAYTNEVAATSSPFSYYKPIYFIAGNPNTKIQLSVKMQPVVDVPLYFAYSQIMFWELRKPSDPMRDINYAPEAFYRFRMGGNSLTEWVDVGFEHESNGKDGWDTRSWNRSYLRYFKRFSLGQPQLDVSVRGWVPYGYDELSPDLPKYKGVYEGILTLSHFLGGFLSESDFSFRFYGGGANYINPAKGGQEVTLRLRFNGKKFLPAIVVQAFNGYGESQLDYDKKYYSWRVGIGL